MQKIVKNTLLNYIPNDIKIERKNEINPARIFSINARSVKSGNIIYLCEREVRAKDNFALNFAVKKRDDLNLPLRIIHPNINYNYPSKQKFIEKQLTEAQKNFRDLDLNFEIIDKTPDEIIREIKPAILIIDFNPILDRNYLQNADFKIYEIDGHNIVPARFVSDKQEYSAATLRRKIYRNIFPFLSEFDNLSTDKIEADLALEDFIKNRLPHYGEMKNNFTKNFLSGMSKYINLGFISSQRIALEVIKSNASRENKEAFLEELVIRKELADNFCLHCENFKDFSSIPFWAKTSLNQHKFDLRTYIYQPEELEKADTHDELWNATQIQLTKEGTIHGYLRMYWAKKILEWTESPEDALEIAIYLNDKYAYDAPSANGYTGILWAIGGLHDRAFADYPVTGKIRRMTYNSIKRKYDLSDFVKKFSSVY